MGSSKVGVKELGAGGRGALWAHITFPQGRPCGARSHAFRVTKSLASLLLAEVDLPLDHVWEMKAKEGRTREGEGREMVQAGNKLHVHEHMHPGKQEQAHTHTQTFEEEKGERGCE